MMRRARPRRPEGLICSRRPSSPRYKPGLTQARRREKLRALGTTGKARSSVLPDVPTVDEAGVPGYEATIWLGMLAPKGTPAAIVTRLNAEIGRITGNPDVRRSWAAQGAVPMTMGVDEFTDTAGVQLAGALPPPLGLATVYVAAVTTRAADPALAGRLVALLAGNATRDDRARCGFELD